MKDNTTHPAPATLFIANCAKEKIEGGLKDFMTITRNRAPDLQISYLWALRRWIDAQLGIPKAESDQP